MKDEAIDFLLYSYFGIDQNDLETLKEDKIIEICAQRAYRDLNRTLDFKEKPDGKKMRRESELKKLTKPFAKQFALRSKSKSKFS